MAPVAFAAYPPLDLSGLPAHWQDAFVGLINAPDGLQNFYIHAQPPALQLGLRVQRSEMDPPTFFEFARALHEATAPK